MKPDEALYSSFSLVAAVAQATPSKLAPLTAEQRAKDAKYILNRR